MASSRPSTVIGFDPGRRDENANNAAETTVGRIVDMGRSFQGSGARTLLLRGAARSTIFA